MRFAPGQSGNPNGRPKGSGDKRLRLRKMLEERGEEVVHTLLDMAIVDRDKDALKIIMDRICPKPKADSVNLGIQVNNLNDRTDMRKMLSELMNGAIAGDVPDEQGKVLAMLAKTASEMDDKIDMINRLEMIEKKLSL